MTSEANKGLEVAYEWACKRREYLEKQLHDLQREYVARCITESAGHSIGYLGTLAEEMKTVELKTVRDIFHRLAEGQRRIPTTENADGLALLESWGVLTKVMTVEIRPPGMPQHLIYLAHVEAEPTREEILEHWRASDIRYYAGDVDDDMAFQVVKFVAYYRSNIKVLY